MRFFTAISASATTSLSNVFSSAFSAIIGKAFDWFVKAFMLLLVDVVFRAVWVTNTGGQLLLNLKLFAMYELSLLYAFFPESAFAFLQSVFVIGITYELLVYFMGSNILPGHKQHTTHHAT